MFETLIPRNIRLAEAPSFGKPIIQHDPFCTGAVAYRNLAREFIERRGDGVAQNRPALGRGLDGMLETQIGSTGIPLTTNASIAPEAVGCEEN